MHIATLSMPAIAKWIGAFAFAQWLSIAAPSRAALTTLIILMAIDYATGLIVAFSSKTVSSNVGRDGLVRKGLTLILVMTCHFVESATGLELHLEMAGAIGFSVNEFISIIENCARGGVRIPAQLAAALIAVKKLRLQGATPEQLRELADDKGDTK